MGFIVNLSQSIYLYMASGPARLLYGVFIGSLALARVVVMVAMMIQFLGSRGLLACAVNSFRGRANVVATKEFLHTKGSSNEMRLEVGQMCRISGWRTEVAHCNLARNVSIPGSSFAHFWSGIQ